MTISTIRIGSGTYGLEQLVSLRIAAQLLGLAYRTVQDMAARRELPVYKVNRSVCVFRSNVTAHSDLS